MLMNSKIELENVSRFKQYNEYLSFKEDIMSRKFLAYDSIKNGGKKKAPAKKKK